MGQASSALALEFAEVQRVVSPGGRVVVGFVPKERMERMGMPVDIFTARDLDDVIEALGKAGFGGARLMRPAPTTPWNVIVATRKDDESNKGTS